MNVIDLLLFRKKTFYISSSANLKLCPAQLVCFFNFCAFHENSFEIQVYLSVQGSLVCTWYSLIIMPKCFKISQLLKENHYGGDIFEMLISFWAEVDFVSLCYNLHYCEFLHHKYVFHTHYIRNLCIINCKQFHCLIEPLEKLDWKLKWIILVNYPF